MERFEQRKKKRTVRYDKSKGMGRMVECFFVDVGVRAFGAQAVCLQDVSMYNADFLYLGQSWTLISEPSLTILD